MHILVLYLRYLSFTYLSCYLLPLSHYLLCSLLPFPHLIFLVCVVPKAEPDTCIILSHSKVVLPSFLHFFKLTFLANFLHCFLLFMHPMTLYWGGLLFLLIALFIDSFNKGMELSFSLLLCKCFGFM